LAAVAAPASRAFTYAVAGSTDVVRGAPVPVGLRGTSKGTEHAEPAGHPASATCAAAAAVLAGCGIAHAARRSREGAAAAGATGPRLKQRASRKRSAVVRQVATIDTQATMTSENEAIVSKSSVLVLGATGTLGRQVVRQFISAGYNVKCIIREKEDRPFSYLTDWGASLIQGSLVAPESLPAALIGVHTVIDCATARPEDPTFDIDWNGKKAFIQCCEAMKVQRYIFCSIKDCDKYTNVPLMNIKYKTEQFLAKTSLRHTVIRITGFMQPLIPQFAFAVLDDQPVWGDDGTSPGIAYVDSQDCARFIAAAASKDRTIGQTLTVSGPKVWTTAEVIKLCEEYSGKGADVNVVPSAVLQLTQAAASSFTWGIDVAERLRFVEVNRADASMARDVMTTETYDILGVDEGSTRTLETYFKEYYRRMFKRITQGEFIPEEGEAERLQQEEEEKLSKAVKKDDADYLPEGYGPEEVVTVLEQREMANRLFDHFVLKRAESDTSDEKQWFGLTPIAEIVNGRSAMFGISLGVFTEWATGVSVSRQITELFDILSPGRS